MILDEYTWEYLQDDLEEQLQEIQAETDEEKLKRVAELNQIIREVIGQ